ncbi:unnamed protein product [Paramecium sonneborni]|uniref:Signal recognition particle 54 kDa protein n=1 Tax=Paramecium sonneborni TaxID=65129 RepID=A0A8S1RQN2_9CILI|nr:unnamed protein product [Paramecium sonneborni]
MVLTELGQQIKEILKRLSNNKQEINKAFVDQILDDISMILLKADVNAKIVLKMRENIKYEFKLHGTELINLQQFILKCIIEQLTEIFQNDIEPYQPKKGKTNVIMFIGLQGSGKTTTCFKYGYYYQKRGWKVGIVCADTLSLDQTKQNAMKLRIPFYGSYTQSDPIQVTYEGIIKFKKERVELILVDTPGKYKEELVLFEEIKQVQNIIQLNNIIFISIIYDKIQNNAYLI